MGFNDSSSTFQVLVSQANAAEKAYLGCLLSSGELLESKDIRISPSECYSQNISFTLESYIELINEGTIPDLVSIRQRLIDKGKYDTVGGNQFLVSILGGDYNYHNIRKYESLIKENSLKIKTQQVIDKIIKDDERSAGNILTYGQELIQLATNGMGGGTSGGFNMSHAHSLADKIAILDGKDLYGFSFGKEFHFLDLATKGIQKGKTYRIGAPSNVGKTQMAYSIINNLLEQGARVAFFTLENEVETTLGYLMSNHQRVSMDSIMKGSTPGDFDYITKIHPNLGIFDNSFYMNDIFSKIVEFNPDVVILDYIGLMSIKGFTEDSKYTEYAIQVQRFVKQVQVSWIDLSNLPTQLQQSEDIRGNPQFFGSTFLRNNTDVGIHITPWKEFYDARERILSDNFFDNDEFAKEGKTPYSTSSLNDLRNKIKRYSGVNVFISKNRLGPHSISGNYLIDFGRGAEFKEFSSSDLKNLLSQYGLG